MFITREDFIKLTTFPISGVPKNITFKDSAVFIRAVVKELLLANNPETPDWLIFEFVSDLKVRPANPALKALEEVSKSGDYTDAVDMTRKAILKTKEQYIAERDKFRPPKNCLYVKDGLVQNDVNVEAIVYDRPGEMLLNAAINLPKLKYLFITPAVTRIPNGSVFNCPNATVYCLSADTVVSDNDLNVVVPSAGDNADLLKRIDELTDEVIKAEEQANIDKTDYTNEIDNLRRELAEAKSGQSSPVIVKMQEQIDALIQEKADMASAKDALQSTVDTLTADLEESRRKAESLEASTNSIKEAHERVVAGHNSELVSLREQIVSLTKENEALKAAQSVKQDSKELNEATVRLQATKDVLLKTQKDLKYHQEILEEREKRIAELEEKLEAANSKLSEMLTGDSYNNVQVEKALQTINRAAQDGALSTEKIQQVGQAMSKNKRKNKPIDTIRAIMQEHGIDLSREQEIIDECFNSLTPAQRKYAKSTEAAVAESLEYYLSQQEKKGPTMDDVRAAVVKKYGATENVEKKLDELRRNAELISDSRVAKTIEEKMLMLV